MPNSNGEPNENVTRMRFAYGTIGAAIFGGAVLVVLVPWGDPCSFADARCDADETIRNIVFTAICVLIDLTGGLLARIRRPLAGAISIIAAALLAHFGTRWAYGLDPPSPNFLEPFTLLQAVVGTVLLAGLGAVGGFSRATFAYRRV
jgi:hypothetical protein